MSQLTINEAGSSTFTDEFTVDVSDFSVANAGTLADSATKSFDYTIPAGAYVQKVAFTSGKLYSAAGKEFKMLFTPDVGGTAYSLNELTQGSITFFFEIARL
jgi:hypothetical protein